jgi:hypothetical protein
MNDASNSPKWRNAQGTEWTAAELRKIERLARHDARPSEAARMFPGRSANSVRLKLWRAKQELGINRSADGPPILDDAWMRRDAKACIRLGEAIERMLARA